MTFQWRKDLSDDDYTPAWICNMPDGSEISVEQSVSPRNGRLIWHSLLRVGTDGEPFGISAVFESRLEAQQAAEIFYVRQTSPRRLLRQSNE